MPSMSVTSSFFGKVSTSRGRVRQSPSGARYIRLRCPVCATNLPSITYHALGQSHEALECYRCGYRLAQERAIWLALAEGRQAYFRRFIEVYEMVRRSEGRGSDDPAFYRSLPFQDRTGRFSWQWGIRARTYRYLTDRLLLVSEGQDPAPLTILDLGAGNGWLSHRLVLMGHRPVAVDLQTNAFDGLGAAVHFQSSLPTLFPRFQAELDRLPFADGQFDVAIFNASFHYSENYDVTLKEAIRCLRPGGRVLIADSPSYQREESGRLMLEERHAEFEKRFGTTCQALASREYLTEKMLTDVGARLGVKWKTHRVWYGLRWATRPLVARLRRRREPSQFRVYETQVKNP